MKKVTLLLGLAMMIAVGGCKKDKPTEPSRSCTITSPENGAEHSIYDDLVVTVETKENIVMVTVYLDDAPYAATLTKPYTATIPSTLLSLGSSTLKAIAVDNVGAQKESATITITITDDAGGDETESPSFVTFTNGIIPPSWKTSTWEVDIAMGYDDSYSLRSKDYPASVLTTKTMSAPSYVEFYTRGDNFDLYIDRNKKQPFSSTAEGNWKKWVYIFEKGQHEFLWETTLGAAVYLDAVRFGTATLPQVTTNEITDITATSATAGGNVTLNGNRSITARGVCWSTSENPTIDNNKTTDGTGTGAFISEITGLTLGMVYYLRAYATNEIGTAYGEQIIFTTDPLKIPTVTTYDISNITSTTAQCGGNVTADGYTPVTARGVCWSISENPTINDSKTSNGSGTGDFTSNITGLTHGTLYYVRAYATNSIGTAYGEQKTFTTLTINLPTVTTADVTKITSTAAKCGGNVTNDGNSSVTARGVCWSTSPNPTINDDKTTNGTGTGSFTSNVTGLIKNKLYYIRAYATNSAGTAYGEQKSFTPKLAIGENYQGGVIAYIDNTGEHGLIAAKQDQNDCLGWCYGNTVVTGATETAYGTGKNNTTKIVQAQGIGVSMYAARLCNDLVLNGYSDWFLPSKDELNLLYENRDAIGGFTSFNKMYWSSTEYDIDYAWYQSFSDYGTQSISVKNTTGSSCVAVRAVRYF